MSLDLEQIIGLLAKEFGEGFIPRIIESGNVEFRRPKLDSVRLPFSMGVVIDKGIEYDRLVISADTLKGPKWKPTNPNSKFTHDPIAGEILYSDNGVRWVLKFQHRKIVMSKRQ